MEAKIATSKWQFVGLAFEMGYIIAIPLVIFVFGGKYLDARFGTKPWLVIAGFILAISSTTLWLGRRFAEMRRSLQTPDISQLKK